MSVTEILILLSMTLGVLCNETGCKPLVSIPGGDDLLTKDGNASKVTNITLNIQGHIVFNGEASIDIIALAGAELGPQFFLKFIYKVSPLPTQGQDVKPLQPLVANCDGRKPSIWIFVGPNQVEMGLKTEKSDPVSITLPGRSDFNTVTLKYDGRQVVARANDLEETKPLTGNIEMRERGIVLGQCSGIPSFVGLVDEFIISKCDPTENNGAT